eukprot:gnl/Trimastix_PCT/4522.p1 GENE.gnl/Trimastix_PCT/4522~~gnl/Trimastix_PCT/4522.p1  ORF type:complete len:607 (+),score=52.80 gnl/Trimastix_PCT/4522:82-1902(+)
MFNPTELLKRLRSPAQSASPSVLSYPHAPTVPPASPFHPSPLTSPQLGRNAPHVPSSYGHGNPATPIAPSPMDYFRTASAPSNPLQIAPPHEPIPTPFPPTPYSPHATSHMTSSPMLTLRKPVASPFISNPPISEAKPTSSPSLLDSLRSTSYLQQADGSIPDANSNMDMLASPDAEPLPDLNRAGAEELQGIILSLQNRMEHLTSMNDQLKRQLEASDQDLLNSTRSPDGQSVVISDARIRSLIAQRNELLLDFERTHDRQDKEIAQLRQTVKRLERESTELRKSLETVTQERDRLVQRAEQETRKYEKEYSELEGIVQQLKDRYAQATQENETSKAHLEEERRVREALEAQLADAQQEIQKEREKLDQARKARTKSTPQRNGPVDAYLSLASVSPQSKGSETPCSAFSPTPLVASADLPSSASSRLSSSHAHIPSHTKLPSAHTSTHTHIAHNTTISSVSTPVSAPPLTLSSPSPPLHLSLSDPSYHNPTGSNPTITPPPPPPMKHTHTRKGVGQGPKVNLTYGAKPPPFVGGKGAQRVAKLDTGTIRLPAPPRPKTAGCSPSTSATASKHHKHAHTATLHLAPEVKKNTPAVLSIDLSSLALQ